MHHINDRDKRSLRRLHREGKIKGPALAYYKIVRAAWGGKGVHLTAEDCHAVVNLDEAVVQVLTTILEGEGAFDE